MNTQELAQQIADNVGVDAQAVDTLAKMCADRIAKWGVEVDADSMTAAIMESQKAHKTMCIKALTHPEQFNRTIHNMVAQ